MLTTRGDRFHWLHQITSSAFFLFGIIIDIDIDNNRYSIQFMVPIYYNINYLLKNINLVI